MALTHQEIKDFIERISIFSCFDPEFLEEISRKVTIKKVFSGDFVLRQGDHDGSLYLLYAGRLSVLNGDKKISEISPGIIFGEMSIISKENRKSSIIALRDSIVFEFNGYLLSRMFARNYQFLLGLTEIAFKRVTLLPQSLLPQTSFQVLAIFYPDERESDFKIYLQEVTAQSSKKIKYLQEADCFENNQFSLEKAYNLLKSYELDHDFVFLLSGSSVSEWARFCISQAETLFSFFYYMENTQLSPVEEYLKGHNKSAHKSNYLVMLHDENTVMPKNMKFWLEKRQVNTLFNIKLNDEKHASRLGRILTGQSTCLILSGGGARACAHYALLRLLEEQDIPIDFIGGASAGAIIAFSYAKALDWKKSYEIFRKQILKYSGIDLTVPTIALSKGERVNAGLIESFDDSCIEDLWLNSFCVSTIFKSGQTYVHQKGLAWRAMRASLSIPGVYPPVTNDEGELLIDGSISNNLPFNCIPFGFPNLNIILSTVHYKDKLQHPEFLRNCDGGVSGFKYLITKNTRKNYPDILGTIVGAIFNKPPVGYEELIKKGIKIKEIKHQVKYGIMDFKYVDEIFAEAYADLPQKIW